MTEPMTEQTKEQTMDEPAERDARRCAELIVHGWLDSVERADRLHVPLPFVLAEIIEPFFDARDQLIAELRAQLPETMQNCTIRFKQCTKGHGWLTADNWLPFDCPTCERDALRESNAQKDREIEELREIIDRLDLLAEQVGVMGDVTMNGHAATLAIKQVAALKQQLAEMTNWFHAHRDMAEEKLREAQRREAMFAQWADQRAGKLAEMGKVMDTFATDAETVLCHVAQLLDGWHQDGTAWSEWDESVRQSVSELQRKAMALRQKEK